MSRHAVFHYFLLDDRKHYTEKTATNSKDIMGLLQNKKVLMTNKSTIWDNIYGCADKYRCTTVLYLLSTFYHAYKILIYHDVGASGHGKYVAYGLNATDNFFLSILMTTVKFLGSATNNSQVVMHTSIVNTDISIERGLKKSFRTNTRTWLDWSWKRQETS